MQSSGTQVIPARWWHYASLRNVRWMNDPAVTRYLRTRERATLLGCLRYYLRHAPHNHLLAIYHDGEHVGNGGFFNLQPQGAAELRIVIGETRLWGRGIASRALQKMITFAHRHHLNPVWLDVSDENAAAMKLYSAAGFQHRPESDHIVEGRRQWRMELSSP